MKAMIDRMLARLRAVFSKPELDADFAAELEYHLEALTEDNIKAGMTPAEARRRARIALGGLEQTKELHRETRGLPWLEQFAQDFCYAIRLFRKERGFTVVALLILAIGIGLNTTVFSLVNTVLLRPIPFSNAERLVWITNGDPVAPRDNLSFISSRVDTWEGLQQTSRSLEQIEAYNPFSVRQTYRLTGAGDPETIIAVQVSHGLFGMLGVNPMLGRAFLKEDAEKNAPFRVMISYQLWQRRFSRDPLIVGKTVQINGAAVEVIGVLPKADAFTSAFFPAVGVDIYQALRNDYARNWGNTVTLIGRAKSGLTLDAVRADLALSAAQLKKQYPERDQYFNANVMPLQDWITGTLKRPLFFLWIAAGLVLAIVSFDLGGLLLARGASRGKELALRCALGAGRWRIVRQLLTECFVLVATGSALGTLLAWGFIHFLSVRSSVEIPLLQNLRLDSMSLGFTVFLCVITVVLCGAAPAWKLSIGGEIQTALNEASRGSSGGWRQARTRSTLVILEVAFACVLAISAGLMTRSFSNLLKTDLGFNPSNLVALRIDPVIDVPHGGFLNNILDRVRAMPGVEQAGITDCLPVERDRSWGLYPVIQDKPNDQRWTGAHVRVVSPGLLAAMGTTLLSGRDYTLTDDQDHPGAIIINQSLSRQMWPGEDAVGRQVKINGQIICTVIGVAADVRHSGPEQGSGNEMYMSLYQFGDGSSWDLMVRTRLPVATLRTDLRNALRDVDATLPLSKLRPMSLLVDRTLSSRRLMLSMIGTFAAIALGLAALGLYGLVSYMVTQQTKEIGIRMALGAPASLVQRQIVCRTMRLAAWGLMLGLLGALAASRSMESLLYKVSALDAFTYIITAVLLLACSLLAGYLPARRASRLDPLIALRAE